MTSIVPMAIDNAVGDESDGWVLHGSVALRSYSAVADSWNTDDPDLMEISHKAKRWTCKRGEVDAAIVHFDFGGGPRRSGRKRR